MIFTSSSWILIVKNINRITKRDLLDSYKVNIADEIIFVYRSSLIVNILLINRSNECFAVYVNMNTYMQQ